MLDSLIDLPLIKQGNAKVVVRSGVLGLQQESCLSVCYCFLHISQLEKRVTQDAMS